MLDSQTIGKWVTFLAELKCSIDFSWVGGSILIDDSLPKFDSHNRLNQTMGRDDPV
jgi:hypothetical protein